MVSLLVVLSVSFLLGSIPSSLWVGQIFHKTDIRTQGSGNLGTTNAFRILGWKSGVSVLVLDFMKGFAASFWVSLYAFEIGNGPIAPPGWEADAFLKITCGLMAVVGHMFPIFANFKGGKGAATACGMLFGIEPISISISSVVFIAITFSTRYVSLASITASFIYPISLVIMRYGFGYYVDGSIIIFATFIAAGIIYKHKSNIRRLLDGNENRVNLYGKKNKEEEEQAAEKLAEAEA
ncbi:MULTISPECIES: glycerol-3-phosphate 1-O-acyltransferase PlsY [Gracilimonas]|uniref:Glycerol-3-phosphate acyltransferase n=1 Tax=Gracilimonas sediminicola TaxID=2952158 RepID=A0A9X2L388_9BACT|nr:glycerol-3-phosphate 1-O-acyltransferase PlsY [Gracilimonas sediminicola]MCP9291526.1 glycerol-3-phosphate 1-O-acyltransferase PlsY [Gracilimonas sediminicola]